MYGLIVDQSFIALILGFRFANCLCNYLRIKFVMVFFWRHVFQFIKEHVRKQKSNLSWIDFVKSSLIYRMEEVYSTRVMSTEWKPCTNMSHWREEKIYIRENEIWVWLLVCIKCYSIRKKGTFCCKRMTSPDTGGYASLWPQWKF